MYIFKRFNIDTKIYNSITFETRFWLRILLKHNTFDLNQLNLGFGFYGSFICITSINLCVSCVIVFSICHKPTIIWLLTQQIGIKTLAILTILIVTCKKCSNMILNKLEVIKQCDYKHKREEKRTQENYVVQHENPCYIK